MSGGGRLLDQVRDVIRIKHYSIRTEQAYLQWIRRYILFHGKRHPSELGSEHLSTFLSHLGGKLEMRSRVPLKTRDDLSMAYTPGVARVSRAIADDPESIWNLTIKRNTVAVGQRCSGWATSVPAARCR